MPLAACWAGGRRRGTTRCRRWNGVRARRQGVTRYTRYYLHTTLHPIPIPHTPTAPRASTHTTWCLLWRSTCAAARTPAFYRQLPTIYYLPCLTHIPAAFASCCTHRLRLHYRAHTVCCLRTLDLAGTPPHPPTHTPHATPGRRRHRHLPAPPAWHKRRWWWTWRRREEQAISLLTCWHLSPRATTSITLLFTRGDVPPRSPDGGWNVLVPHTAAAHRLTP